MAIAVGGFLIIMAVMFWRRRYAMVSIIKCRADHFRQVKNQWNRFRPSALPFNNNQNNNGPTDYGYNQQGGSYNPYANNPPPPNQTNSSWSTNPYGRNPSQPAQVYQPSTAGQYGRYGNKEAGPETGESHEHGYEWAQARENERLEREQSGAAAPPGYDVSAQNTGSYAPPPGPPPAKA